MTDYIQLLQQEVNKNPDRLVDVGKEEEQEEGPPPCRTLPKLCSIPRKLVVSPDLGGSPVTPQLTQSLRRILFGGTFHVFSYEWRKSFFQFREPDSEGSYALEADRWRSHLLRGVFQGGARAIQMVVQARIIKYLLFIRQSSAERRTLRRDPSSFGSAVNMAAQNNSRFKRGNNHSETWDAAQPGRGTEGTGPSAGGGVDRLPLAGRPGGQCHRHLGDRRRRRHPDYKLDHFTERLQLFTFTRKEDVRKFLLEHIQCFKEEGSHGVILFLYSLICSRTVDRLKEDLDSTTSHLLYLSLGNFVCRQALLNLLLTGKASPNVFNGTQSSGVDGRPLERPLQGVLSRGDVGYLHWSREQMERGRLPQVGSMLKTPRFPVWICCINSSFSVLFGLNRSLLSDWKMEHLFQLFYSNGQNPQRATVRLTVDTHSHHWEASCKRSDGEPETRFPSLEMTIRTKWDGAAIDWSGTVPFY